MSSPDINYPVQPTYGEGMADAMKAQMEQLLGQGEYAQMYADAGFAGGNLGDIIAGVEGPIRQQTAQTDTDILRQTLLGTERKVVKDPETGKYGIPGSEVVQSSGDSRYQVVMIAPGKTVDKSGHLVGYVHAYSPTYAIFDTETGAIAKEVGGEHIGEYSYNSSRSYERASALKLATAASNDPENAPIKSISDEYQKIINTAAESGDSEVYQKFNFINPNTGEPLKEGEVVREGDGMIDLLGDRRNVKGYQQDPDYTSYVKNDEGLNSYFQQLRLSGDTRTIEEFGRDHYEEFGRAEGRELPMKYSEVDTGRQAGFDEQGNFLGLSALAEDIQQGNLSRQREADLADVERLSDRYQKVMEDYAPATTTGIRGARDLVEEQKEALTVGRNAVSLPSESTYSGDMTASKMTAATVGEAPSLSAETSYDPSANVSGGTFDTTTSYDPSAGVTGGTFNASTSYDPSADVSGGTFDAGTSYKAQSVADPLALTADTSYEPSANVAGATYQATQAGNPMALTAATSYTPSASVTGDGYTATAGLKGGNVGADALRSALLSNAEKSLAGGLTERELANISNAFRARSGMMGRTFDQQGAIAEAQALVAEDNARRMQNRAFAGDTLSRETDIQRDDLGRGLQAAMQNQAALNRAAEFGASQNIQAQLANQAATNQALQAGITAGLSQEALAAQQKQAQEFANQAASNRALEFGASTSMDAQRLNQAATNQALSQGLSAGLSQEALAAQQAQAKALADASATNRASEFGISSALDQEARANQAALQAALANQQAINQAAQFGVGSGLDQEARANQANLQASLANQQAINQASQFGVSAGMQQQAQANQAALQAQLANQQATNQAAQFGVGAGMEQDALRAQLGQQTNLAQAQMDQQASAFDADAAQRASQVNQAQAQQAAQFGVGATMDAERLNEQLRQQGLGNYINAVGNLAQIEDTYTLDPFQALLGRGGGGSLASGQSVFGQAGYGLQSGPQYLNPESGLGYISQMAANQANMYAANQAANASRSAGMMGMFGDIGGSLIGLKKPF